MSIVSNVAGSITSGERDADVELSAHDCDAAGEHNGKPRSNGDIQRERFGHRAVHVSVAEEQWDGRDEYHWRDEFELHDARDGGGG